MTGEKHTQREVITFKADADLVRAMKGIRNRSEFIRSAILSAIKNICPLCGGTGLLTPNQQEHWQDFTETHSLNECGDCNQLHIQCQHERPSAEQ